LIFFRNFEIFLNYGVGSSISGSSIGDGAWATTGEWTVLMAGPA